LLWISISLTIYTAYRSIYLNKWEDADRAAAGVCHFNAVAVVGDTFIGICNPICTTDWSIYFFANTLGSFTFACMLNFDAHTFCLATVAVSVPIDTTYWIGNSNAKTWFLG
jgi:hypothetical protein